MDIHRDTVDAALIADRVQCGGGPVCGVDARGLQVARDLAQRAEPREFRHPVAMHDVDIGRGATGIGRLELVVVIAPVGRQCGDRDTVQLGIGGIDDRLDDAGLAGGDGGVGSGVFAGSEEAREGYFLRGRAGGHCRGRNRGE